MQSEYRVKRIYTEEDGGVVAKCYDIIYGEDFEKYLGYPNDFDGKENASMLLQDSTYEMTDELRNELMTTFGLDEFMDDQDYDGYQFYDFEDDEELDDDFDDEKALALLGRDKRESFNLREALNQIDLDTYNKYDLLNLYESCNLSENEKRVLANIVYDQEDASVIYDTLNNRYVSGEEIGMPERVKDGVIHEDINEGYELLSGTKVEVYSDYEIAKARAKELGLKEAEYGDIYRTNYSYCYWNESGDRNDEEQVIVYYTFENGKPRALTETEREEVINRFEIGSFDNEAMEDDMGTYFDDIQPELEESVIDDYTVGDDLKFIGNAQIIKASQLPKIGEKFKGGITTSVDKVGFEEGYIIYKVGVTEEDSLDIYDEFEVDTAHWLFAVKGFKESVEDDLGDDELNAFYKGYTEEDKDENSAYNRLKNNIESKSINESDEETPYTKEEIERDLKSITHNFTDKDGELKCGFEEEKNFGVEILKQHYKVVETSGDDRREGTWYHISFAEPLNKNESVDPSLLDDCPECGDKSFDTKKGKCTKCNYRE